MPSTLCPGKPSRMNVPFISQNSFHGLLGAKALIPSFGTLWVICHHKSGVQQGDPLGPLFFSLVLWKITMAIDADDDCSLALLFNAWFLDDGVLAGRKSALCSIIN